MITNATAANAPASVAMWTAYEEHMGTCTVCPETGAVTDSTGNVAEGNCPEALRLLDVFNAQTEREAEAAVNRWYPPSRYSEEERAAARSHFTWHGDDCGCGV
jgi:hypothetical protein